MCMCACQSLPCFASEPQTWMPCNEVIGPQVYLIHIRNHCGQHTLYPLFVSLSNVLRGYQNPLGHLQTVLGQELGDLTQSVSQDIRPPASSLPWAGSWPTLKAQQLGCPLSSSEGQMLAVRLDSTLQLVTLCCNQIRVHLSHIASGFVGAVNKVKDLTDNEHSGLPLQSQPVPPQACCSWL